MVVILLEDHFVIILIAAVLPQHIQIKLDEFKWQESSDSASFNRNFLLVWDWEMSSEVGAVRNDMWIEVNNLQSDDPQIRGEVWPNYIIRIWNVMGISIDARDYGTAE
jgi:hypothetical protein